MNVRFVFFTRAELNLGVERSSFTLIGSYRETADQSRFVRVRRLCQGKEAYALSG